MLYERRLCSRRGTRSLLLIPVCRGRNIVAFFDMIYVKICTSSKKQICPLKGFVPVASAKCR